jgi:hypothetical protein
MPISRKKTLRILLVTGSLLAALFVAMQSSGEMAWSGFDFILAGLLISGMSFAWELFASRANGGVYRAALAMALAGSLLLFWANLAVGLIGGEDHPANRIYFGVLALGVVGAVAARLRAAGMVKVMASMAAAQALVPVIALAMGLVNVEALGGSMNVLRILAGNMLFAGVFAGSAVLFRRAVIPERSPLAEA